MIDSDHAVREPRPKTAAAAAADAIRQRILAGDYEAGRQLRQDALAAEFGISRIPVREALVQLEAEGLVRILPHRGAVVSEMSITEIEELFELRALLEPRLLVLSAKHLGEAEHRELERLRDDYGIALHAGEIDRWGDLNVRFHTLLMSRAGRPETLSFVVRLLRACDRYTRLQLSLTRNIGRAEVEHTEILRLCVAGFHSAAAALLRDHIEAAGRSLCTYLSESGIRRTSNAGEASRSALPIV